MARCAACERRRQLAGLMLEAGKLWISNPTGPNIGAVYDRLVRDAIDRGEITLEVLD